MKIKNYWVIGLLIYWVTVLLPSSVFAGEKSLGPLKGFPGAYEPEGKGAGDTITKVVSNLLGILTIIAGLWFTINFLLAGLEWISSSGNPEKVQKAQNKMIHSAVGLITVVAAYSIAFIVSKILGVNILNPAEYLNNFWGKV